MSMEFRASTCKRKFVKIKSRAFVITTYEKASRPCVPKWLSKRFRVRFPKYAFKDAIICLILVRSHAPGACSRWALLHVYVFDSSSGPERIRTNYENNI